MWISQLKTGQKNEQKTEFNTQRASKIILHGSLQTKKMKKDIQHKKLEEENKELKELLRVAELRADLWQHAIEIAEKKFNIEILKKYGAQPSTASISKDQKKK